MRQILASAALLLAACGTHKQSAASTADVISLYVYYVNGTTNEPAAGATVMLLELTEEIIYATQAIARA